MAIPGNPYIAGSPVGDTPAFVGRAVALREVLHVLSRPRDNAIVLYGQRRIGKTSILQYLEAWLPDEGPYCPVYFDLEDKAALPLNQVLWELARTIAHTLGKPDLDLGSDPEVAFRDEWLPAVLDDLPEDCSLVLLFDEFDVLADPQRQEAAKAFFSYLRTLLTVDPRRLQFVFVIGRNVGDLDNIAVSLFKGIPTEQVSLLDREDTVDLIHLSEANGTLRWPDEAAERVWALTCGHPYLTQQLCSHVWHRAYDEEDGESDELPTVAAADVDAAVLDALESGRGTLEWLWRGLPPAERVVAAALAEAGPDPITQQELEGLLTESGVRIVIRELQNAPHLLQEWDLIEPADGGYRFRVELLRRWIADHKPLQRVQDELDRIEPVAENYYQAAVGLYRGGELDQAIAPLRQAISLNPNHVGANQLLADILLAQGQVDEARQLLERLYGYQPAAARPRLVQAILTQAQAAESEDEQLALYRQVLELAPAQREATTKVAEIQPRLVQAILTQAQAAESDDEQLALYRQVLELAPAQREATAKVAEIQLKQLEGLEQQRRYQSALDLARQLAEKYPGMRDWTPDLKRLERKTNLDDLYQRALGALQSGDRGTAQTLLAKVVTEEPGYEEAARYLHEAVTGKRVPWQLIVSGLLLIVSIVLTAWTLARLGSLSAPSVSSFTIDQPRQLGAQQEHASVSGYLDYSDNVPLTEMGIVVYVTGVKPDREGKWRRSSIPCATQVGRQWAVSSDCTAFPGEYTEFSLKAVLVAGGEAARLPLELAASGEDELTSELSKYAYPCSNSAPCNSISPMFQVSRTDVEPTATPTSSPTPSPTPTSTPTPRPTFTPTPSRTPSPSPTSRPTPIVTPTPTYTATATLPPPTDTQRPLPSPTDTPTPTNTKPPPPTSTKPPPPTNTKRPPPTNTKPAP